MLRRPTRCILGMRTVSPGRAINTYSDAAAQTSLSSLADGEFLSPPAGPVAGPGTVGVLIAVQKAPIYVYDCTIASFNPDGSAGIPMSCLGQGGAVTVLSK
jgi:hypothetical protein